MINHICSFHNQNWYTNLLTTLKPIDLTIWYLRSSNNEAAHGPLKNRAQELARRNLQHHGGLLEDPEAKVRRRLIDFWRLLEIYDRYI